MKRWRSTCRRWRAHGPGFEAAGDVFNQTGGFSYGAHVCEVEVDPETGRVAIVAWTGVDDVGLAINPLVLHGQAHGSVTQGIGQALCEAVAYEPGSAQLLSASFMDYALPRADRDAAKGPLWRSLGPTFRSPRRPAGAGRVSDAGRGSSRDRLLWCEKIRQRLRWMRINNQDNICEARA